MRILLTGACGRLGTAVRRVASEAGHEIVSTDVSEAVLSMGGTVAQIDDHERLHRLSRGCDAIIHTAAVTSAHVPTMSHDEFYRVNVGGSDHICRLALASKVPRVVMTSTMSIVFGTCELCGVLDESSSPMPDTIYPLTKYLAEHVGHFYARRHGLEVVQLRLMRVLDRSVAEIGFELLGMSVTAEDCAAACFAAASGPGLRDEVIHIGPDTPLTFADIATATGLARLTGLPGQAIMSGSRVAPDPMQVLERHWPGCSPILARHGLNPLPQHFWPVTRIDKAVGLLGWRPQVTFETFLRELGWEGTGC